MPRRVRHRDHAAERVAEHDRLLDAERVAEVAHVVAPLGEVPLLGRAAIAAAVAAVVEVDELRRVGERRESGLVRRVIEAGTAVQQQQRRPLAHRGSVGDELRAVDVEEEPDVADLDVHGRIVQQERARVQRADRRAGRRCDQRQEGVRRAAAR